jgi:hypothetical protein
MFPGVGKTKFSRVLKIKIPEHSPGRKKFPTPSCSAYQKICTILEFVL